jgi:segregation and condensation protein A
MTDSDLHPNRTAEATPGEAGTEWSGHHIRLESFEGPLDLLLYLIRRHEMDIYEVPIAEIAGQYLAHLDQVESLDLDRAGDYLLVAATLLTIKAAMLLPGREEPEEEDEDLDPERQFALRLVEYQTFKEVSRRLSEAAAGRMKLYPKGGWLVFDGAEEPEEEEEPEADLSINEMLKAFTRLIFTIRPSEGHRVELEAWTVEEKVRAIRARLEREGRFEFLSLFEGLCVREELVVTFVALLELIHAGEARVSQRGNFSTLIVTRAAVGGTG